MCCVILQTFVKFHVCDYIDLRSYGQFALVFFCTFLSVLGNGISQIQILFHDRTFYFLGLRIQGLKE